jgi:hypothetical protein
MTEENVKSQVCFLFTDDSGYTVSANMDISPTESHPVIQELVYSFSRFLLLAGFHEDTIKQYMGPVE